jgi:hypothetical protein
MMEKVPKNPVTLCAIHHHQNPEIVNVQAFVDLQSCSRMPFFVELIYLAVVYPTLSVLNYYVVVYRTHYFCMNYYVVVY